MKEAPGQEESEALGGKKGGGEGTGRKDDQRLGRCRTGTCECGKGA